MDLDDDDITLEVKQDEAPAEDELGAPITEKAEGAAAPTGADEGIDDLRRQLEEQRAAASAERQKAEEARHAAQAERQRAAQLETRVVNGDMQIVQNALDATKERQASIKGAYRDALERGDYDAAANIQEEMTLLATRMSELERGRIAIERKAQQRQQQPDPAASTADPVDTYIAQFSPASQAWLRQHKDCVTDPRMNAKTIGAHHMAVGEGLTPDTPEYFSYLEKQIGLRKDQTDTEERAAPKRQERAERTEVSAQNVSAPVSREVPAMGRGGAIKVTLTAAEREMAKMSGITDQEYAAQKVRAIKNGEINQ